MHQASPQIKTTRHSMEKAELGLEPTTTPAIGGQVLLDVTFTADEERKVVRKIDCIILPMVRQAATTCKFI